MIANGEYSDGHSEEWAEFARARSEAKKAVDELLSRCHDNKTIQFIID